MNLLLISKTAIIKQIFNLVSKKINIKLTISDHFLNETLQEQNNDKIDLIVIDDEILNENISAKTKAKRFGIITKNKNNLKEDCDFIISKPFLPSTLVKTLEEQIKILQNLFETQKEDKEKDDTEVSNSLDFIETLAEDISDEISEESDESIVSAAFVKDGGVLDTNELSKIQNMLDYNEATTIDTKESKTAEPSDDDDWVDLSNIIDKAIDEVREYQFSANKPIKLILNKYSMQELSPLLNKLDQNIIDALTSGEEISLKLKLDKDANFTK
jgi:hypothetical protein